MNPAVTLGVLAAGAMRVGEAIGYIVSQLVGGVIAAFLLAAVLDGPATGLGTPALAHNLALGVTSITITPWAGFVIEAVLAFFLVTIVLSVVVSGRAANLAPLAIGMTVTFNIIMGGALTGAAFNPALVLGPMIVTGNFGNAWLYMTAPIAGALIAAIVHMALAKLSAEMVTAPAPTAAD
jgi:glycerol uptake facilitator-like aquaporin